MLKQHKRSTAQDEDVSPNPSPETEFGERVAVYLSNGTSDIPDRYAERLVDARLKAVAERKIAPHHLVLAFETLRMPWGDLSAKGLRIASLAPLIGLVIGLWVVDRFQSERIYAEKAQVDLELLTDPLPLAAFTDPGFSEYTKRRMRN